MTELRSKDGQLVMTQVLINQEINASQLTIGMASSAFLSSTEKTAKTGKTDKV